MFALEVLNNELITGKSLDEIQKKLYEWEGKYDIGSSQWCLGKLMRIIKGKTILVGWVSYNGRLWAEKP